YETAGPADGRPVVFIHGFWMGSSLWRPLSEQLASRGFSCVAPTWPLGAHTEPMRGGAELTMEGIAGIVGELLEALALEDADIDGLVTEWVEPALGDRGVRNDLGRFTASLTRETTVRAATRLPQFTKPALVAWSADDAFFPLEDGRRLADALPNSRLEVIE